MNTFIYEHDENDEHGVEYNCVTCAKKIPYSVQNKFCDNCAYEEKMYKQLSDQITLIIEGKLAPNTNYYPSHNFFEKNTFTGGSESEFAFPNDNYLPELTESQKHKLFENSLLKKCVCVLCSNELTSADAHTKYCNTCSQIMLKAGWPV